MCFNSEHRVAGPYRITASVLGWRLRHADYESMTIPPTDEIRKRVSELSREADSIERELHRIIDDRRTPNYFDEIRRRVGRLEEIDELLSSSPITRDTLDRPIVDRLIQLLDQLPRPITILLVAVALVVGAILGSWIL